MCGHAFAWYFGVGICVKSKSTDKHFLYRVISLSDLTFETEICSDNNWNQKKQMQQNGKNVQQTQATYQTKCSSKYTYVQF